MANSPTPERTRLPERGSVRCPRCRSTHGFHPVALQEDGGTGCLMLFLGGMIPYLLYSSRRNDLMECENCHLVFRPPRTAGPWESILGLLAFVIVLGVFIYFWLSPGR